MILTRRSLTLRTCWICARIVYCKFVESITCSLIKVHSTFESPTSAKQLHLDDQPGIGVDGSGSRNST